MDAKNIDFGKIVEAIQGEVQMVTSTIKEKTLNRFVKPLGISGAFVFFAYYFVNAAPQKKYAGIERRITTAKAVAEYSDQYNDLHAKLTENYSRLPELKDREHWITDSMIDALKADGLIADSIVPPEENLSDGFAVQRIQVTLTAKFSEFFSLIRRIEAVKPAMHVVGIDVTKGDRLEINNVVLAVGTMVPLKKAP